jgi:arylsulfatase A-like enzyme/Flp pilus assembly protein TadD
MKKYLCSVAAIAVVVAVALGYWWKAHGEEPCNILFITIDTLRADRLGCYGYEKAATPNIDRLAREGIRCTRVYTQSPLTLPSHASLFTGTSPTFHGIRDNNWFRLRDNIPTMATICRDYGYRTGAVVSSAVLSRNKGLARGFIEYDDVPPVSEAWGDTHQKNAERRAGESVALALNQLQRFAATPQTPFFLWLHLYDPHAEYEPPSPFREKFSTSLYDGEVAYVDFALGKLLAQLVIQKSSYRTLIVFTADHGEGLGEHGEMSHGYFLYHSTLHIPLIFHCPGLLPAGKKLDTVMRSMDVMPTSLALLHMENHGLSQGMNLAHFLHTPKETTSTHEMPCYAETYFPLHAFGWRPLSSLLLGDYKYIASRHGELYHLANDAGETHNLLAGTPTVESLGSARHLQERLARFCQETQGQSHVVLQEKNDERLTTLGYHSYPTYPGDSDSLSPQQETTAPESADMVAVIQLFVRAQTLLWLERDVEALPLFEKILQQDPGNITGMALLGKLYTNQNRLAEALATFRELYRRRSHLPMARDAVLDTLIRLRRLDEAGSLISQELSRHKEDGMLLSRLAYLRLSSGQYGEAGDAARQASILSPQLPSGWFYLGSALVAQEKWSEAADAFAHALVVRTPWNEAEYQLGLCWWKAGQVAQARQCLMRALPTATPEWRSKIEELLARMK